MSTKERAETMKVEGRVNENKGKAHEKARAFVRPTSSHDSAWSQDWE